MHISALAQHCHDLAGRLVEVANARSPALIQTAPTAASIVGLIEGFDVTVTIKDFVPAGCSVAGSHTSSSITVVRSDPARMRFTALHELGHVLAEDDDIVQGAIHARAARRELEEDICDAFAARLLLSDDVVARAIATHGRTARGLRELVRSASASREACSVAVAQRLEAPGYVGVIYPSSGILSFAARSGDVFPLRRRLDQSASALGPVLTGPSTLTERGSLRFENGTETHRMYVDAVRSDDLVYFIATEDRADWGAVTTDRLEDEQSSRFEEAHCDKCGTGFMVGRRCRGCTEPIHEDCNGCACEVRPLRGERPCSNCCITYPPAAYPSGGDLCENCA
jgi:hypothetical protein